ncbi:MAG: hypothetical protein VX727_06305 [Planctomycetota bacterium]|nr:hypothetical protein [Planctomycetota bacterium]
MLHRSVCCLLAFMLSGCDGGEPTSTDQDERSSFVDASPPATNDKAPPQQTTRDQSPSCPDVSDAPSSASPIDERGLFDLVGPVHRVEEHFAVYTLTKENKYEQEPLELKRVLLFDEHGQLVACRTNVDRGRIERDEQGRLSKLCLPIGSETLRQKEIRTFDHQGRLKEQWMLDASGDAISRTLTVHDAQDRLQTERTHHWGIMPTVTRAHWTYDAQDRVDEIQIVNSVGEPINTTSYTYNLGSRNVAREQVRGPDGRRLESTDLSLDDEGNWTVRIRSKFRKDSQDNWQERQDSIRRRTIEYFDDASPARSSGDEDD